MTNEKAIDLLRRMQEPEVYEPQITEEAFEALEMAIRALGTDTNVGELISRKAVLYALDKRFDSIPMEQTQEILLLRKDLREMPPITPMQELLEVSANRDYWQAQCRVYKAEIERIQLDIIHCKDCGHRDDHGCCKYWKALAIGDIPIATDDNDFCSHAERRNDVFVER
jgi:hypothetical protein